MAFDCLNIYGLCNKLCQKVMESMMTSDWFDDCTFFCFFLYLAFSWVKAGKFDCLRRFCKKSRLDLHV